MRLPCCRADLWLLLRRLHHRTLDPSMLSRTLTAAASTATSSNPNPVPAAVQTCGRCVDGVITGTPVPQTNPGPNLNLNYNYDWQWRTGRATNYGARRASCVFARVS